MQELAFRSDDGTKLAAHHLGGDGPTLIICHATGFHGRTYAPMAESLTDEFAVWALDFRGHGASEEPPSGDFAWGGMAADLLSLVDALGVTDVLAFGHSLGGASILLAALARPGVIRGAYLFEPIVFPRKDLIGRRRNVMSRAARIRREVFPSRDAVLARYAGRPPLNVLRADALHAYVEHGFVDLPDGSVQLACRAEFEARTFECEEKITIEQIKGLTLPLTVGAGAVAGDPNPAAFAPLLVETIADSTLIWYETLGHFGPFEAPLTIATDIQAALTEKP